MFQKKQKQVCPLKGTLDILDLRGPFRSQENPDLSETEKLIVQACMCVHVCESMNIHVFKCIYVSLGGIHEHV